MSASQAALTPTAARSMATSNARPSFLGLLRGELFKIARLRITWIMTLVFTVFIVGSQLILVSGPNTKSQLQGDSLGSFYTLMEGDLSFLRIFSGIFLLILTAHVIGLEYQHGTIRILLGRGVGRLQLLGAKMLALTLVVLSVLVVELLIELVFGWGIVVSLAGNSHPWSVLGSEFWVDVRYYLLYVLLNAGVTLLLGVAASVVGRSLAFGLTVGLCWFAVDNLASIPLNMVYQLTHSHFWLDISSFLLGPLLNRLPDYIAPPYHVTLPGPHGAITIAKSVSGFGVLPLVSVSGGHALAVIFAYAAIFAAVAIVLMWRREVLE